MCHQNPQVGRTFSCTEFQCRSSWWLTVTVKTQACLLVAGSFHSNQTTHLIGWTFASQTTRKKRLNILYLMNYRPSNRLLCMLEHFFGRTSKVMWFSEQSRQHGFQNHSLTNLYVSSLREMNTHSFVCLSSLISTMLQIPRSSLLACGSRWTSQKAFRDYQMLTCN